MYSPAVLCPRSGHQLLSKDILPLPTESLAPHLGEQPRGDVFTGTSVRVHDPYVPHPPAAHHPTVQELGLAPEAALANMMVIMKKKKYEIKSRHLPISSKYTHTFVLAFFLWK